MRHAVVAIVALVLLSVVASALTPAQRPRVRRELAGPTSVRTIASPRAPAPSPANALWRARAAAAGFLNGYLPFVYGRASARSVSVVTLGLRSQLMLERTLVTPVERRRHPRVVWIETAGQAPGVAVATALIDDGGIATYALRITLRKGPAGWLVSAVDGG